MNLSKLRRIHVIIIGLVVWVLLSVGLFFVLIKPASENLKKEQARYDAAAPEATPQKRAEAERKLEQAKIEVAKVEAEFNAVLDQKMPNLRFDQRDKGMLDLWHEQVEVLGPLIEKFVKQSGVTMLSSIQIPPPPVNPNDPLFSQDYFVVPIGQVRVSGNFNTILDHIKKWNTFNRLVQIDMPSLEGPSPSLTSTYNMSVYIFPRVTAKGAPEIKIAGAATGQPGGSVTVGVQAPGMMPMGGPMGGPMGPMPGGPMPGGSMPPGGPMPAPMPGMEPTPR